MIDEAKRLIPATKVERTIASKIDTLTGHIGEFVFAQFLFGDWKKHRVGANKGEVDFPDVEIKTSAYPFSETLHLLVREDYARKRKPKFYVQIIIDVESESAEEILPHTKAMLCGYATSEEIDNAPLKDFGSKLGSNGGYKCHYIPITKLHSIEELYNHRQTMALNARYVHTNLIAHDWQALSRFYQEVFGCTPVPPERHYKGNDLERGTGVKGSELHGVHLRLPGYDENGPTLEIYSYTVPEKGVKPAVNRPGFGHIAFTVDDVSKAREIILKANGTAIGEVVTLQTSVGSKVTWCYVTDPEGNIIELQSWG